MTPGRVAELSKRRPRARVLSYAAGRLVGVLNVCFRGGNYERPNGVHECACCGVCTRGHVLDLLLSSVAPFAYIREIRTLGVA